MARLLEFLMRYGTALVLLLISATLEAGGDALVRHALQTPVLGRRFLLMLAGALVLFGYGCLVNAPPWDFGKLLGIYVVCFFLVAQAIGWLSFGQVPSRAVIVGGIFIVIGGAIISVSAR